MHVPSISIITLSDALKAQAITGKDRAFFTSSVSAQKLPLVINIEEESLSDWEALIDLKPALIILSPSANRLHFCRQFFEWLQEQQLNIPVIFILPMLVLKKI